MLTTSEVVYVVQQGTTVQIEAGAVGTPQGQLGPGDKLTLPNRSVIMDAGAFLELMEAVQRQYGPGGGT